MLIGLHDADMEHLKGKSFPNYALMKLAAWHKQQGHTVELFTPKNPFEMEQMTLDGMRPAEVYPPQRKAEIYNLIYSSKIFDFTPENPYLPETAIRGGTGYNVKTTLPPEVDAMFPDYSIYPACDYAIGFLTRGCPNKCSHCVVPEKEGDIKPYRGWRELVRPDSKKLLLMDNNVLACEHGIAELESLAGTGYAIDLNQGMDARLFNERIAAICARLEWVEYIRFSCDSTGQIEAILNAAALLRAHGVKPYRIFVYLLVTKDIDNAAARVEALKGLKNIRIFAQAERNDRKGIIPNKAQKVFAQRYVYGNSFRKETWAEYCSKRGFDPEKQKFNW